MSILEKQNHRESLAKLAALRLLYRHAKRMRGFGTVSVLVVALLGILASVIDSQWYNQTVPLVSLFLWFLDQEILRRREQAFKVEAAVIQEDFDCFVLDLPWPEYKGFARPTSDRIKQLEGKARKREGILEGLENWYGTDEIQDDSIHSKLRCQKASCWWDVNIRRKWGLILKVILVVVLFLVIGLAIIMKITVLQFVAIVASNIRILAWVLAEVREQKNAINRIERIHGILSSFGKEKPVSSSGIRSIQNEIFEHRRTNPPVPEWLYRLTRVDRELEMTRSEV